MAAALGRAGPLLLLLGVAFLCHQYVSDLLPGRRPSNDDSSGAVRLVHIPKTGGAAIVTHLRVNRACPAMDGGGHEVTEATALARSQTPLIVLREPLERLQSAFEYWRQGSEVHKHQPLPQLAQLQSALQAMLPDLSAFVDGLTNTTSARRAAVTSILRTPHILNNWVWDAHFKPQGHWIEHESERSIFVCYSRRLGRRLQCVADELPALAGCNFSSLRVVNKTPPPSSKRSQQQPLLSESHQHAIRSYFARDYALYEHYCGDCLPTCRCCHASGRGSTKPKGCGGGGKSKRKLQASSRSRRTSPARQGHGHFA